MPRSRVPARVGLAAALIAFAVAGPCALWFELGRREAQREALALESEPALAAREAASALARELRDAFESLRERESQRPFFHYQNLFHDPRGAYSDEGVVPSPLAEGPEHELVEGHFQIDPAGRVSMPTLNDEVPERSTRRDPEGQRRLRGRLASVALRCAAALVREEPYLRAAQLPQPLTQSEAKPGPQGLPNDSGQDQPFSQPEHQPEPGPRSQPDAQYAQTQAQLQETHPESDVQDAAAGLPSQLASAGSRQAQAPAAQVKDDPRELQERLKAQQPASPQQVLNISEEVWAQNALANRVYLDIKSRGKASRPGPVEQRAKSAGVSEVLVRVGAMQWHTLEMDGEPALLALRQVTTPQGVWTQGLKVSPASVSRWLNHRKGAVYPARWEAAPGRGEGNAWAWVEGLGWRVSVDASEGREPARRAAAALRGAFVARASAVSCAAALAGAALLALVWQAERLAQRRSEFAASAAHELRTPLAGLLMYGEMLAEGLGDPARSATYARRIADEAQRLGRVVSNVLGFTRLERGGAANKGRPGPLADAVFEALERQRPRLEAAGMRIAWDVQPGPTDAVFDPDALEQMMHNLLDNAEKYSRGAADRLVEVAVSPRGGRIELTVRDHGPGIPAGLARRLFKPFHRSGDADAPSGLGLGLAITRSLARSQGATLAHRPTPGGGASFTVSFAGATSPGEAEAQRVF